MIRRSRFAWPGLLLLGALAVTGGVPAAQPVEKLIAVGDVHGALDAFSGILQETGLVDEQRRWAGGKATLVQTGDVTDRGPDVRAVIDLLMALERQASSSGGRVLSALGNHEVMNILGEYRDVTPEIFATFADARSEGTREAAWSEYERLAAIRKGVRAEVPGVYLQSREAWMAAHPPGFIEYAEAFSPRGRYGSWLRGKPAAVMVQSTVFMHSGLPPESAPDTLDEVVAQVRAEVARFDAYRERLVKARLALPFFTLQEILEATSSEIRTALAVIQAARAAGRDPDLTGFDRALMLEGNEILKMRDGPLLSGEGPLWFRGYANWPDEQLAGPFAALLENWNARRFVVGHTVMPDARIRSRLGGRLFLIDTGMLESVYNGQASALELTSEPAAVYVGSRAPLIPTPPAGRQ